MRISRVLIGNQRWHFLLMAWPWACAVHFCFLTPTHFSNIQWIFLQPQRCSHPGSFVWSYLYKKIKFSKWWLNLRLTTIKVSSPETLEFSKYFKFFKYIKWVDKNCELQNRKPFFNETNLSVENWCEIGEFLFVKLSPVGLILPRALISYVVYFATNAGNEAFLLPFLQW